MGRGRGEGGPCSYPPLLHPPLDNLNRTQQLHPARLQRVHSTSATETAYHPGHSSPPMLLRLLHPPLERPEPRLRPEVDTTHCKQSERERERSQHLVALCGRWAANMPGNV